MLPPPRLACDAPPIDCPDIPDIPDIPDVPDISLPVLPNKKCQRSRPKVRRPSTTS